MRSERHYLIVFIIIFITSFTGLGILTGKYAPIIFGHFIRACRQTPQAYLSSATHLVGLTVVSTFFSTIGILIVKVIFSLIKMRRKMKYLKTLQVKQTPGKLYPLLKQHQIKKKRIIVIEEDELSAFCFGFFSPKIIVSTFLVKVLPRKQLESVILHELYHLRSRHGLLLFISEILSTTLYFLPALHSMLLNLRTKIEIAADEYTVTKQQTNKHLRLALAKVLSDKYSDSSHLSFSQYGIEGRVAQIVGRKGQNQKIPIWKTVLSLAVFLLEVGLLAVPTQNHAREANASVRYLTDCFSNQCSLDCLKEKN